MKSRFKIFLFSGLIISQLAAPVSMIAKREFVLKQGTPFKFKTAAVDPYDAFRGRYVALRVQANKVARPAGVNLHYGQKVFALIMVDERGFAKISQVATQKPKGSPYLMARVSHPSGDDVFLNLLIDRYYMAEKSAPKAEQIYREHNRREKQNSYVLVRIKDGFAVVEGLYINELRIEEVLKKS